MFIARKWKAVGLLAYVFASSPNFSAGEPVCNKRTKQSPSGAMAAIFGAKYNPKPLPE